MTSDKQCLFFSVHPSNRWLGVHMVVTGLRMPSDSSSDSSGCCGLLSTKLFMTDIRPPFPLRKVGLRFPGLLRLFMGGSLLRGILSAEVTDGGEGVYESGGCFVIAMFEEVDGEEQLGNGREDCDGGGRPLLLVPPIRL